MSANLRSSAKLTFVNLASRLLGFGREVTKAALLGASPLGDAFQIAFTIPNLFRRISAEGVMLNTFMPNFTRAHKEKGTLEAQNLFFSLFWLLASVMGLSTVAFIYFAPYIVKNLFAAGFDAETLATTVSLSRIMFGYIVFISLAALMQGVLNYHRSFVLPAITPLSLNIIIITAGLLSYAYGGQVLDGLSIGVLLGGLSQALIPLPFVLRRGYHLFKGKFSFRPYLSTMLRNALPGTLGAGIYQIDIAISNLIATSLIPGSVIALSLSNRLMELALGVFVISQTTVLLPSLARLFWQQKIAQARQLLIDSLGLIAFLILPVACGLSLSALEVISLLFERGRFDQAAVIMTSQIVIFHMPGMIFIGWNRALVTCYQSKRLFYSTMWIALGTTSINLSLALILSKQFGAPGIALANSISQAAQFLLLSGLIYWQTGIRLSWIKLFSTSLYKTILAALALVIAVILIAKIDFSSQLMQLGSKVIAGAGAYLAVSLMLRSPELKKILSLVNKK